MFDNTSIFWWKNICGQRNVATQIYVRPRRRRSSGVEQQQRSPKPESLSNLLEVVKHEQKREPSSRASDDGGARRIALTLVGGAQEGAALKEIERQLKTRIQEMTPADVQEFF